ncbi:hypothetical protein [Demequina salsinemoris]|uniref:hypothetical protein n=1 Tax=Demequina salsinemoris TaxID=577470 RepID=UPI0007816319|nr:hypothetical protein [Demequina salsinemoris]
MGIRGILVSAVVVAVLAGCSAGDDASRDEHGDHGSPGAVIDVREAVEYYPACGDESLTIDGVAWYPYQPTNLADFPDDPLEDAGVTEAAALVDPVYLPIGAGTVAAAASAARAVAAASIAPPDPGDDIGTMVIYEGDFAYWVSDSGVSDGWLTTDVIDYDWIC